MLVDLRDQGIVLRAIQDVIFGLRTGALSIVPILRIAAALPAHSHTAGGQSIAAERSRVGGLPAAQK